MTKSSRPPKLDPLFTVHCHDAREIGKVLDKALGPTDQKVMATVTSPPYFNLLNYGDTANQIGYGQRYDEYLDDCKQVFSQIHNRTDDAGSLWIVADTLLDQTHAPSRLRNLPFDLADKCEEIGWILRDVIIWHKDKARPWSQAGRMRNSFEYVLYFIKSSAFKYHVDRIREPAELARWWVKYPERYNPKGKAPENVWKYSIPSQGSWANTSVRHACPLPPNLVERILLLVTDPGDVVCDPFAGSGTVVAEAERLGRPGVGTELNPEYVSAYKKIVRPDLLGRKANDLSMSQRLSSELESSINKLRAVKIARATWHEYRKRYPDGPLPSHVVAIAAPRKGPSERHHLQDVSLSFVLDADEATMESVQSRLKEVTARPPLTKYGIAGDIRVLPAEAAAHQFRDQTLWLYENGHTWASSGQVEIDDLLEMPPSLGRMHYPAIASNVEVRIAPE